MLASSSPPKVSRLRHGPRSSATTRAPPSVRTFAVAAPEAPAPMMQTSARAGFALSATVGLPIFLRLAICEPIERAVAASENLIQRGGAGKADDFPADMILVPAIDRIGVEDLAGVQRQQRHEGEIGFGRRLLQWRRFAFLQSSAFF